MSGVELPLVGTRIAPCSGCETPLPLFEAASPDEARVWLCSRCGAEHRGKLSSDYTIPELRNIRPESVTFDPQAVQPIDPDILAFAQRLGATDRHRVERRSSPRHDVVAVLTAVEFDEQLCPVGSPFQTICRNLSAGGICLINGNEIRSDFLVIELAGAGGVFIQTLARLLRRRSIGPYFDIGVEFVTKLAARVDGNCVDDAIR